MPAQWYIAVSSFPRTSGPQAAGEQAGSPSAGGARRAVEVQSSSEDSELRLRRHQEDAPIQDFIARDSDATSASEGARPSLDDVTCPPL